MLLSGNATNMAASLFGIIPRELLSLRRQSEKVLKASPSAAQNAGWVCRYARNVAESPATALLNDGSAFDFLLNSWVLLLICPIKKNRGPQINGGGYNGLD